MSMVLNGMTDGATARDNTGISSETRECTERLKLLYDVAEEASSVPEVSELIQEVLVVTQRELRASAASLFMVDQEQQLYVQAAEGEVANALKQIRLRLNSGIVGWVARCAEPTISNDVTRDDRFDKEVDKITGFVTKSILAVPLMRGRRIIGVLELLNKIDGEAFNDRDLRVLTGLVSAEALILLVSMVGTAIDNIRLSQTVLDSYRSTIESLVTAADAGNPYALGHSRRVKEYTVSAASSFDFSPEKLRVVEFGALLHDIGNIGINESILRESGKLTTEEWCIIREHPQKGANIVEDIPYLGKSRDIILNHHEKPDGSGYPAGLRGDSIPIGARLVAVADAFDDMTTAHSYRAALSIDEAMSELVRCRGTQFCPVAVEAFISGFKAGKLAKIEVREAGEVEGSDNLAKKGAARAARKAEAAVDDIGSMICDGEVRLVVPSLIRFEQMRQFQEGLEKVENLKIVVVGGSVGNGGFIVVSARKPMALGRVLEEIPAVEKVEMIGKKSKKEIVVTLKDSRE